MARALCGGCVLGLLCWHCQAAAPDELESTPSAAGRSSAAELAAIARERPIVFTSSRSNGNYGELYLTQPDGNGLLRITSERSAFEPVWSPDGRTIAFRRLTTLSEDRFVSRLELLLADASERVVLAEEDEVTFDFERSRPQGGISWSPDGLSLAYASPRGADHLRIWLLSRSGGQQRLLFSELNQPHYSPSWSRSDASKLAYIAEIDGVRDVWLVDPENPAERRNLTQGRVSALGGLRWSPRGDRLAFPALDPEPTTAGGIDREIYVLTLETLELTQITNDDAADTEPAWSPDGASLLFASDRLRLASQAPNSARTHDLWLAPLADPGHAIDITPGGGGDDREADWFWPSSAIEP